MSVIYKNEFFFFKMNDVCAYALIDKNKREFSFALPTYMMSKKKNFFKVECVCTYAIINKHKRGGVHRNSNINIYEKKDMLYT